MPSIVNGLFAGRAGLASHGISIAVIGDNIGNASTIGYKQQRSEFADLVAGGQGSKVTVGSGSRVAATTMVFSQGTLEFTGKPLDLAVDGNGFFAVADGASRFYTRAGNFKISPSGFVVTQDDKSVLGFPEGGSGALQSLNVNSISQDGIATTTMTLAGNADADTAVIDLALDVPQVTTVAEAAAGDGDGGTAGEQAAFDVTYADLNSIADFSTSVDVFDSLGASHTITYYFFHTGANEYTVRGYVNSDDVDAPDGVTWAAESGRPRLLDDGAGGTDIILDFDPDGTRTAPVPTEDITYVTPWNNGSDPAQTVDVLFDPYTQFSTSSSVVSITQDGQGVGNITSFQVDKNGDIFALLDNGQQSIIGKIGLVSFANPEALSRVGNNLLQQSIGSGEPVVGEPLTGTFGAVEAGSVELSTVDIADQFVKLITLQRGFQANSRIITTINQLLNEIIQLA